MIVVLDSEYPCAMGGPVLTAVDPRIFSLRYFTHCMACGFCHDACCDHGVDIDVENAARLRALPKEFHDRVGAPAADWFTAEVITDREFPGGAHVRTAIRNGACIFRNAAGRGCTIHAYCLEQGLDYHSLKPMVSVLFPVTFENGVLTASGEAADGSLVCAGTGPSLYDGARDELRYYFGDGLIAELDQLKANYD
jgi:NAD-dependent dihydropyrimidine dehydrogenase PreA subunit